MTPLLPVVAYDMDVPVPNVAHGPMMPLASVGPDVNVTVLLSLPSPEPLKSTVAPAERLSAPMVKVDEPLLRETDDMIADWPDARLTVPTLVEYVGWLAASWKKFSVPPFRLMGAEVPRRLTATLGFVLSIVNMRRHC